MELFDSTKTRLYELLRDVEKGKIQLPDFQRGWIWDDFRIKGLLASIAKSYPIGAIMLLETGNETIKFKTRLVESVKANGTPEKPEKLILDGQQRITSLFQSIISNQAVKTRNEKGQEINRWYYIDMTRALDPDGDIEDAIFSVNERKQKTEDFGRRVVLDLSTPEMEYRNMMYPVHLVDEYSNWRMEFYKYWQYVPEKTMFWDEFESKLINNFTTYMLPVIVLKKENTKEAVCQVFEKVNTGGVSLNVFELLTATYASDNYDLREHWMKQKEAFHHYQLLRQVDNTDFLQAVSLLSTYSRKMTLKNAGEPEDRLPAVSCKRKDILNLSLEEFTRHETRAARGFALAAKLLTEAYIFKSEDLPYASQLVPLSAILGVLDHEAENIAVKEKIMQWFWCGVFGELYGAANETRYALDIQQVIDWIRLNGAEPHTVYEANFNPSRLHTLRTRNSAAYKGIYALLIKDGALDFINGKRIDVSTYFSEYIDIHHIFPKRWCISNNLPRKDFDCIINKTPLSYRTNRIIGGEAPSKYLEGIIRRLNGDRQLMTRILQSHVIDPEHLYRDDFYAFFNFRKEQMLVRIEQAMRKRIERETIVVEPEGSDGEEEADGFLQDSSFPV